jgi:hypothetical protein
VVAPPPKTEVPPLPVNGLRLTGTLTPPPIGVAGMTGAQNRQLGFAEQGEHIPMEHAGDGVCPQWQKLAHSFVTDLCIVIAEGHRDEAWLGIWTRDDLRPLLIHKLPLRITPDATIPY